MAKNRNNREAEKNKKKDSGLLKKAVGVAAIAGVGYAGFKNRGNISNFIKKTEGAANRLAIRGASNPELRGVTRQLGNITGGITDTVGENPGLKGFGRFLLNNSDEALDKNIQNRIARSMSSSRTNNIVSSLESKREGLNAAGRITARAKEADKQHQIQKLLTEKGRMQNFFGENTESVMAMLKDSRNSKLLQKDEIAKSGNPESFNRRIKEFLIDNHEGSGRASENTFKLKFNREAEKETGEFQGKMMEFLDEVNERTSQNVKNYSAIKNGKKVSSKMMEDNVFSKQIQLQEAIAFKGLRESSSPKNSASRMSKSLEARGFRMSTIDDALNFEMTSGQKLGDEFAHARFSTGNQEKIIKENLAKTYKNKAENYGLNYNEFKDDIFAKEIFIHNKTGEVLNTSYLDNAIEKGNTFGQEHFQVPFLKFNPWDIAQYKNQLSKKKAPVFDIFKSGEVLPFIDQAKLKTGVPFELRNLNSSAKPIANDYLYSGSKLYNTDFSGYNGKTSKDAFNFLEENLSSLVVEDNLSLVNVKSGFYKRFGESVSGRTNISTKDTPGPIKTLFGFGQEEESVFSRGRRAFKKFDDPLYSGNLIDTLYSTENAEEAENVVNRMYNLLYGQTKEMSADTRNATYDTLSKALNTKYGTTDINLAKMSDDDGILEVAQQIAKYSNKNKSTIETSVTKQIEDSLESHISNSFNNFYGKSDTQFNASKRFLKDRNVVTNEMISSMNMYPDREVPQVKDLKRLIEEFSISSAERQNITVQDLIKDSMKNGNYTSTVENELYQMNSLGKISFFREKVRNDNSKEFEAGVNSLKQFLSESSEETASLHYSLKKADPWYGTGVGDSPFEEILGQSAVRTPIKKHRGMLETINAEFTDNGAVGVAKSYADSVGSLFAGAKNRDKITDATSLSYFMTSRLDSALTQVGLGLPNSQKGSAQAILFNQWGRRIVLPYMAFQTAKYADGLTGDNFSDGAADAYVNMHEDVARFKDITGLNALGKGVANYLPGYDQIQEWAPVKALNKVTFGLFGDNRSGDEVRKYYESGEDPIRKGRFWGIGSTSMWMGDKVDRYEPNWYRKLKSDYQFSENMYGSEKEYWANNWMPTLTNPFAPIKHFITDPYHYENKHKEDRPYAVTGGFDELNQIPLIGPVVDSVVSGILKPTRTDSRLKASHKEYLTEYNERLARSYTSLNTGGQIESSPGGGYSFKPNAIDVQIRDEDGNLDEESLQDDYLYQKSESGGRNGYVASVAMGAPGFRGGSANATALGSPNLGVVSQAGARGKGSVSSGIAGSSVRQILSTMNRNLSDNSSNPGAVSASQVGSFENPGTVFNLNDTTNLQDLSSLDGPLRDVIYNAGEIGGMFGFLGKTAAGFEESGRGAVLESSERFGSYNNSFWNKELGGLGGDISEIFRRYLPRDPNKNYYNPIRNTMPGWMPGAEYFTDFKHGDPYSKVASGEMRLPGEAYEKLYNVKQDANGNYSAFDRYRILADVAPYSDSYRAAKKEMSLMNQNGILDEDQQAEYKEIRQQVKEKKTKRHHYANKFRNSEINKETVTVTRVIDANTFLTKEYGNNPLKLAGVAVKSTDTENKEFLEQYIKVGARLKVGIDADPQRRIRDDMMDTMRVVVYADKAAEGSMGGMFGLGPGGNINYALSKRSEEHGGKVTVKDDGSATSTQALNKEITVGKFSEWLTHDVLPNTPVVGVFADKFLQVRSPVEDYEARLYSKDWRDWTHPISGWVRPMIEKTAKRNPLVSFGFGYGLGKLAGRKGNSWMGLATGLTFGAVSGIRTLHDVADEITPGDKQQWIPGRRQKERDIDEYFDKIKYVKYHGLYMRAKQEAKNREGIDLDEVFAERKAAGQKNKGFKKYLESKKKWLSIDKKSGYGDKGAIENDLAQIKMDLENIDDDRLTQELGSYGALAMRYKEEFESTLYASEDNPDFRKIYRALPTKDKQYFTEFAKASPKERQKIIKLVPRNQRRIYQQQWNMDLDRKVDLKEYFSDHNLPDKNWEGWDPSNSLDSVKVKVMQNEGLDLTEANFWDDHEQRAEDQNAKAVDIQKGPMSSFINTNSLEEALRGAGLRDVRVSMMATESSQVSFNSNIKVERDRSGEIKKGLMANLVSGLMG